MKIRFGRFFPSVQQWQSWSLPSKLTAIGALLGLLSIVLGLLGFIYTIAADMWPLHKTSPSIEERLETSVEPERELTIGSSFYYAIDRSLLPYLLFITTNIGEKDIVLAEQTLFFDAGSGPQFVIGLSSDMPNDYPVRLHPGDQYKKYYGLVDLVDFFEQRKEFSVEEDTDFYLEAKTTLGSIYTSNSVKFSRMVEVHDNYVESNPGVVEGSGHYPQVGAENL